MVKSVSGLIVGIICLIVAIAFAVIDKGISLGTIGLLLIAIACIYVAIRW